MESTANWSIPARAPDADPLDAYGDVLSVADAAELFRMSPQAVAGWLRDGVLHGKKDGRRWAIERDEIRELLQKGSNR